MGGYPLSTSFVAPQQVLSRPFLLFSFSPRTHEFMMLLTAAASTADSSPAPSPLLQGMQLCPKTLEGVHVKPLPGPIRPCPHWRPAATGRRGCSRARSLFVQDRRRVSGPMTPLGPAGLQNQNNIPCSGGPPTDVREDESDEDNLEAAFYTPCNYIGRSKVCAIHLASLVSGIVSARVLPACLLARVCLCPCLCLSQPVWLSG